MRLLGGAMVALAGLWTGLLARARLRRELDRCDRLCRLLELLGFELERFRTPLPELFTALSRSLPGETADLCRRVGGELARGRPFSALWEEMTAALPAAEQEILAPLGAVLGRYGAEEQAAAAESALRRMEELRRSRRERLREQGRVRLALCAGGGLMLAALLL